MATNVYFQSGNTSGTTNEQRLVEDLVIESLKIYGHDVHYMPRTLVNRDTIFDEDELSKFTQQYPLEMYMENVEGYEGEGGECWRPGLRPCVRCAADGGFTNRRGLPVDQGEVKRSAKRLLISCILWQGM